MASTRGDRRLMLLIAMAIFAACLVAITTLVLAAIMLSMVRSGNTPTASNLDTNVQDIDECDSNPCLNNGTCVNKINSFNCICPGGFVGNRCETEINECASNPCFNNGTCVDKISSFNCTCPGGFIGNRCETEINECDSNPCYNDGTCFDKINSFNCTCPGGFIGNRCETDVDECASGLHSCHSSRATCINTVGSYNCSCDLPYTGDGRTCNLVSECQNYSSLNSAGRKMTYSTIGSHCDRRMTHGWYRFEGAAGKQMASSCPPMNRCNTTTTGWLRGGHPNVSDGQVSRMVCFHFSGNCCMLSTTIQVRNCSSFYVYYLTGTPYCPFRFCGSD